MASLGCCVGMSAPFRKNMAISGALFVIWHVRTARWLLYVSSPRVADIISYAYIEEMNNFTEVYFVLRLLWKILEQPNPFLQRAYASNWLVWQCFWMCFLIRISVEWILCGSRKHNFLHPQMACKSLALNCLFFISKRTVMARKILFDLFIYYFSKTTRFHLFAATQIA